MSSTSTNTQYDFTFTIDSNNTYADGGFMLPAGIGIDDTFAFALLEALNGVPWPAGVRKPFVVSKNAYESTNFTTDTSTSPPSFT